MSWLPPAVLYLRIDRTARRPLRLWLPLFLLWPLALALAVIAVVVAALTDVVLIAVGRRFHRYTELLVRSLLALNETRGLSIDIHPSNANGFELTLR
jgi:hypothetical protein